MTTEYIEKQSALDIVNGWRNQLIPTYGENDEYVKCLETVAEHLESLHAADVRPVVRGRWKPFDLTYGRSIYSCTSCVEATYVPTEMGKPTYRHCPNCGSYNGGDADGDEKD